MRTRSDFAAAIARHTPHDDTFDVALPGVRLIRCSTPTLPMPVVYEPTVCFVAQGRKRAMLGTTAYDYSPAQYLVASVELPVMGAVVQATETEPYLSVQLDLNVAELSELALRHPPPPGTAGAGSTGLTLNAATDELVDAVARLVGLLDTPDDIAALAPLVTGEILYRLLTGPGGAVVRDMAQLDSRLSHIARAIIWIRENFTGACRIDRAADVAGMSRSTFHLHFKSVTGLTPIEFRTQLRMQAARRLMTSEAVDAASAGFRVGYESPSHFSRDYSRLFGMPPARDAIRLRALGA